MTNEKTQTSPQVNDTDTAPRPTAPLPGVSELGASDLDFTDGAEISEATE